jgi:hypothetical protein
MRLWRSWRVSGRVSERVSGRVSGGACGGVSGGVSGREMAFIGCGGRGWVSRT